MNSKWNEAFNCKSRSSRDFLNKKFDKKNGLRNEIKIKKKIIPKISNQFFKVK